MPEPPPVAYTGVSGRHQENCSARSSLVVSFPSRRWGSFSIPTLDRSCSSAAFAAAAPDSCRDIGDIRTSLADIKASLRVIQWMLGFTLAFVIALTWRVFQ